MINLIPPHAKRFVIKEYWSRAITVMLWLVTMAVMIVALFHVPSYVLLTALERSYQSQAAAANDIKENEQELSRTVDEINTMSSYLVAARTEVSFADVRQRLTSLAGDVVEIERLEFQSALVAETPNVTIYGTAATRNDLASFRDALVAEPDIAAVDLPLSSLAADQDLSFQMSIDITPPTE